MSLINRMLLELDARQGVYGGNDEDIIGHLKPVAESRMPDSKKLIMAVSLALTVIATTMFILMRHNAVLPATPIQAGPQSVPATIADADTTADTIQTPTVISKPATNVSPSNVASSTNQQPDQTPPLTTAAVNNDQVTVHTQTPDKTTQPGPATIDGNRHTDDEAVTFLSVTRSVPDTTDSKPEHEQTTNSSEHYAAALHYYNQGKIDKSIDLLYETIMLEPDNIDARTFLASLLLKQQHWQEAEQLLTTSLQRMPDNLSLNRMLARLKIEQGQDDMAIALLESPALQQQVDARSAALLGLLYQRQKRYQDSADYYRQALRLQPGQGKWWLGLAITLEALGDRQGAGKSYRLAAESPNLETALRQYARQRRAMIASTPSPTQAIDTAKTTPSSLSKPDNKLAKATTPDTLLSPAGVKSP